jgi:hypothetical protein
VGIGPVLLAQKTPRRQDYITGKHPMMGTRMFIYSFVTFVWFVGRNSGCIPLGLKNMAWLAFRESIG